jgi:hypothetical protein
MFQRFILAVQQSNLTKQEKRAALQSVARDTTSGFITSMRHLFMAFGITSIAMLAMMFIKPELADKFKNLSPSLRQKPLSKQKYHHQALRC